MKTQKFSTKKKSTPDFIQPLQGRFLDGEFVFFSPRALETIDFQSPRPPAEGTFLYIYIYKYIYIYTYIHTVGGIGRQAF